MTEPHDSPDSSDGALPSGRPLDDIRVRDSGLVAGGSVVLQAQNAAGRDLLSVGEITINQHITPASDTDALIDRLLVTLPPPVQDAIGRLRGQNREVAAHLVGALANRQVPPAVVIQDLTGSPLPPWMADSSTPIDAWVAVAEFAHAHSRDKLAAELLAKVASLGGPNRAFWLARAALDAAAADERQAAGAYLDDAERLAAGDTVRFVAAVRAAIAGDAAGILAVAGPSPDLARLEPTEFAMLCAEAYAVSGDIDAAISAFELLTTRYPSLAGFPLRAAQMLLQRVHSKASPSRVMDLRRARDLAVQARDARRVWHGDSAEAVTCACQAAVLANDFEGVLAYGLAIPAGRANAAEAAAPAVLGWTAKAAVVLGRVDLANRLIDQFSDPAEQAILLGQLAERDPQAAERARGAYHRALALATDDGQRLEIVQGLADLGEWPLPWLEELRAHDADLAEIVTATSESARGHHAQAIRRLRPLQGTSRPAARVLAEVQGWAGQIDDAVRTLRTGSRRFNDPHFLTIAAITLFEADRWEEAREVAVQALGVTSSDSPDRSVLRHLLSDEAWQRRDWPTVEEQARALLDEGATDPDQWWLLLAAVFNQGRPDDAWAIARRAPDLDPDNEGQARLWLALHGRFASDATAVERALALLERYGGSEEFAAAAIGTIIMMARNASLPEPTAARLQQATGGFFDRFPSSTLLQRITFDGPETLLAELGARLAPGVAEYAEIRRRVAQGTSPVGMLAVAARKPYAEALLRRAVGFLLAHPADPALADLERQAAADALDTAVVVEPSTLYMGSLVPDRWADLLATFSQVNLPDASLHDILSARDGLALRSTMSMSWDPDQQRPRVVEISEADADLLARQAAWMAQAAGALEVVPTGALTQFPEVDDEHTRPWLAPLELAKQQGLAVCSDDLVLRALARSLGIPTFGTVALLDALVAADRLDDPTRDATLLELRRHRVVDLPFNEAHLLALAEADQWQPGSAFFALTRPAAWQDRRRALSLYRAGWRRINATDPGQLPAWLYAAILGFAGGQPSAEATAGAGLLLTLTALEANLDPATFAKLLPAAREAATELGGGDPLPKAVHDIAPIFIDALGHADGTRHVLRVFSELDPPDRLLAVRELLAGQA